MMQSRSCCKAVAQGEVIERLEVGGLHNPLVVGQFEFDYLSKKPNCVSGLHHSLNYEDGTVDLGVVHRAHNRSLLRDQKTNFRDGVSRSIGSLDNRPRVENHLFRCGHSMGCVCSGTHPPPCRSASRTSTRSGPSCSMSASLLSRSTKSVALSRASRKVEGESLGGVPGSAMTASIAAVAALSTVLFYFSKFPSSTALDWHERS